ncbi:hypothetical protein Vafri_15329 [Volvox africanus]|uniref:Uncharacterized protein n=1 Tax=Volvox africanus TaxID=51714 RepID=A0A8J4F5M0_9CHLO|nr:hypothetical protein Vafri_15329 [Volvox africanus]
MQSAKLQLPCTTSPPPHPQLDPLKLQPQPPTSRTPRGTSRPAPPRPHLRPTSGLPGSPLPSGDAAVISSGTSTWLRPPTLPLPTPRPAPTPPAPLAPLPLLGLLREYSPAEPP